MNASNRPARSSEAGFTIVEGLVAALILAVVLIGILPLITMSMRNNVQGQDAIREVSGTVDRIESLISLPWDRAEVVVPPGSTSLQYVDYFLLDANYWSPTPQTGLLRQQQTRTTTVELFGYNDIDGEPTGVFETPLDGTSEAVEGKFMRISVKLQTGRKFVADSSYDVVMFKSQ